MDVNEHKRLYPTHTLRHKFK